MSEGLIFQPKLITCLDERENDSCEGPVEMRLRPSDWKSFPRCDRHWKKRIEEQERIDRLYAPNSDVPPPGFDPADAGERWDDDY